MIVILKTDTYENVANKTTKIKFTIRNHISIDFLTWYKFFIAFNK